MKYMWLHTVPTLGQFDLYIKYREPTYEHTALGTKQFPAETILA